MMAADRFAPHAGLAQRLLPHVAQLPGDAAHDLSHLYRVWANVLRLWQAEGGDLELLAAATILHDCVAVEKSSALRPQASRLSAERAQQILSAMGWDAPRCEAVAHAVAAHSFSAGIAPETIEARILQDADRLDAIGLVGVARCFHVAGRNGRALYDADDPLATGRALDDMRFALDHFSTKLLRLADGFQTATGRALARIRHERLAGFRDGLLDEIGAAAEVPAGLGG